MIVEVGFSAKRDEKGNFRPAGPIYYSFPKFRPKRDKYALPLRKPIYLSNTAQWDLYFLFLDMFKERAEELLREATAKKEEEKDETNGEQT